MRKKELYSDRSDNECRDLACIKDCFYKTMRAQVNLVLINGALGFQNKECLCCSEGKQQFLQLLA